MLGVLSGSAKYMSGQVDSNPDINTLAQSDNLIATYVDTIRAELTEIATICATLGSRTASSKDAKEIVVKFQAVDSVAVLLGSYLGMASLSSQSSGNVFTKASTWVSGTLIPWIKSMWGSVWAVVCTLISPKEWKIGGSVGTSLLGLANAEVEITFS